MAGRTDQRPQTKTLPIPKHGASQEDTTPPAVLQGEIVDDDAKAKGRRRRSRGLEDRWERRREEEARHRPAGASVELDPISRLRRDVETAGRLYMDSVRKAEVLSADRTPAQRTAKLTGLHKAYASMMVLACMKPLGEGVNAKNVLNVVGMGAAMWMLSPNFRTQVGEFGTQVKAAVTTKIQERRQSNLDKAQKKAWKEGRPLSVKWQQRLDDVERGGRIAFTAKSAAMTEVALAETMYSAMRQEGADVEGLALVHSDLIETLYQQAAEDGIDAKDIATAARVVVGLRLEDEPHLACVFSDLAHGQYARSDSREVRIGDNGETAWVWTGEFESRLGEQVEAGSFGFRPPMTADQHQKAIADTMTSDMISLTMQNGVDGLNVGVVSYAAAWGLKDNADFGSMLQMDNPLGERLRTSSLMMGTMSDDGLSMEEQQRVYSNAYVDSMEYISMLYPEVEKEWAEKFGSEWRQNMRDFVSNPHDYMDMTADQNPGPAPRAAWEAGPARSPEGSAPPASRTYRQARINQNYIETSKTGLTGFGSDSSDFRDEGFDLGG